MKAGVTKNISSLVKATDSDGDTITKYRVKDTTGVNSFYVSGSAVNASGGNGYEFNASALSTLSLKGDPSGSEQTMQVAAYDGVAWSSWVSFKLTSVVNRAPSVSVTVPVLNINEWIKKGIQRTFTFSIQTSDQDGDEITKYWISTPTKGHALWSQRLGYFWAANGGQEFLPSDLSTLWVRGHSQFLDQEFAIKVYDGQD